MKINELEEELIALIIDQGKASEEDNYRLNNKLAAKSVKVFNKLCKIIGEQNTLQSLIKYLSHDNDYVKFAIAARVHFLEPELSKEAMKKVANSNSEAKVAAEIILKQMNDNTFTSFK